VERLRAWSLEIQTGGSPRRIDLEGDLLTLGSAATNAIAFPSDDAMSKLHAILERQPVGWSIRDAGSANGTLVNGETLDGERLLAHGDEVVLGVTRIAVRGETPASPAEATPGATGYLDSSEEWLAPGDSGAAAAPVPTAERGSPPSTPLPEPRAPSPRRPVEVASRPGHGRTHVRGVARNVQVRRSARDSREILAFRVDRYDEAGNRVDAVAVEFRGYMGGQVSEGDEVDVRGKWSRGTVRAKEVTNVSTNSEIRGVSGGLKVVSSVFVVVFVAIWLSVAAVIVYEFVKN
jgi:FHA domain